MRKVIKKPEQTPAGSSRWELTRVAVDTRSLVQFGADHPTWHVIAHGGPPDLKGINCRIQRKEQK